MKVQPRQRRQQIHALLAIALALASGESSAQSQPAYSIDLHTISAGGQTLSNSCFRLSGTLGEVAPGYSGNASDSLFAGFWSAVSVRGVDEIFFAGFEGC